MIIDLSPKPVIYFDGVCNLCNSSVQFVIKHDKRKLFLFAPLQSSVSMEAALHASKEGAPNRSVILFSKGQYYIKSAAALHILRLMGGFWSVFYVFIIVPRFIRDGVYDFVSRNRYKWFGKKSSCMVPAPDIAKRFISQ